MAYRGIRFQYDSFIQDVRSFAKLAEPFLDPQGLAALKAFAGKLEDTQHATWQRPWHLGIPKERPVVTRRSEGEYRDSDNHPGTDVFGTVSCTWQVVNAERNRRRQRFFDLVGIASTSVCICRADTGVEVARWQFEVGDHQSPGCHFHASANQDQSDGVFPDWLKVPRLPAILFVPMDCIEFLLGELFQRRWHQHVSRPDSDDVNRWAKSQSERLSKLFVWQAQRIKSYETTPWMTLKKAKPPLDLLSED